jgi:hypothetical protein
MAKSLISLFVILSVVALCTSASTSYVQKDFQMKLSDPRRSETTLSASSSLDNSSSGDQKSHKEVRRHDTTAKIELPTRDFSSNAVATKPNSLRRTAIKNILAGWGVIQVLSILANAIKRVVPVAIQPFVQRDLEPAQAVVCFIWCTYMLYTEGYKTFQLKFSPLVVKRAFGLSENLSLLNCLLAGPYCMGLFGATRKRMIVSWSVTLGVFAIVKIVKKLPYPWRAIVDAGVVLGLSYGVVVMCLQTVRAMFGYIPDVDECLPLKGSESSINQPQKK